MFWNFVVSLGLWIISCIVWAIIVLIGTVAISPPVNRTAQLIVAVSLFIFWVIVPYSWQIEDEKRNNLQSRLDSGLFLAFAGVLSFVYILSYVVGALHILESGMSSFTVVVIFASYLITTAVIWWQKWASPAISIIIGSVGPGCLVALVGVFKMAVTLTVTGSLAIVALALMLFLFGYGTNMTREYDKPSNDLS